MQAIRQWRRRTYGLLGLSGVLVVGLAVAVVM